MGIVKAVAPITPIPEQDTSVTFKCRADFEDARDKFHMEQLIRAHEVTVVRDKLKWCYRREGVNHMQNCREIADQYLELISQHNGGWFRGFKEPRINEQ